jgi:hypothetical protein
MACLCKSFVAGQAAFVFRGGKHSGGPVTKAEHKFPATNAVHKFSATKAKHKFPKPGHSLQLSHQPYSGFPLPK